MSKCLTVVALVLLVLTGAMGLRNVTANAATISTSSISAPVFISTAIGPAPPIPGGGGHVQATAIGPAPPIPGGGGHVRATGSVRLRRFQVAAAMCGNRDRSGSTDPRWRRPLAERETR